MDQKSNFIKFCLLSLAVHLLFFLSLFYVRQAAQSISEIYTYEFVPFSENRKSHVKPIVKTISRLPVKENINAQAEVNNKVSTEDTSSGQDENQLPTVQPDSLLSEGVRIVNMEAVTESVKRTPEAILNNIEGKIKLKLLIDEKGNLRKISAINSLGFGLDEVAIQAAQKLIFLPARINLKPVAVEIYYTVKFTVNHH